MATKNRPYSCNYLQYVETFIYFSHKLVCIPPTAWINTCHRHGVKVLGTFIMEGDAHAKAIGKMFDQTDGEYVVARRLASMAKTYGFDGWLLNIETDFPYAIQHPVSNLTAFIRSLKRFLGASGIVIWYDAITKDNDVDYQNALTWKNVDFALAADAFFTNYKWTEQRLHETAAVAEQHGIKLAEVYFGIDVWAQNTNMPGPPRVTYPPTGGGGTLTGLVGEISPEACGYALLKSCPGGTRSGTRTIFHSNLWTSMAIRALSELGFLSIRGSRTRATIRVSTYFDYWARRAFDKRITGGGRRACNVGRYTAAR